MRFLLLLGRDIGNYGQRKIRAAINCQTSGGQTWGGLTGPMGVQSDGHDFLFTKEGLPKLVFLSIVAHDGGAQRRGDTQEFADLRLIRT